VRPLANRASKPIRVESIGQGPTAIGFAFLVNINFDISEKERGREGRSVKEARRGKRLHVPSKTAKVRETKDHICGTDVNMSKAKLGDLCQRQMRRR
jgi:hypothetical protein